MTLTKKPARPPSKQIPPQALPLKQGVRPPIKPRNPNADPLGLFPALSEQLKQTYDAQLRAFLRKVDLVRFAPAVRQRIRAAETASGGPATFLVALTVHTLAMHQASLAWLAGWRPPSKRRQPTRRPTLRKTERTPSAFSATKVLRADSSRCG